MIISTSFAATAFEQVDRPLIINILTPSKAPGVTLINISFFISATFWDD
jgi:hypothetical protein